MLKPLFYLTSLAVCLTGGAAAAATIVNGGFEAPGSFSGSYMTLHAGSSDLSGWAIESGSIDLINTLWQHSEGQYSIDLSGQGPGVISTSLTGLQAGSSYALSFDMAANPDGRPSDKALQVDVAGLSQMFASTSSGNRQAMNWVTFTLVFTATQSDEVLRFSSLTDTSYGPTLDNVRFASAVPLPAGGLLLLGALGGLAGWRRRKAA